MLTKKQKNAFKRIAVLSLLLGCVMIVPFRTFSQELGHTLDVVVKGIIIPLIIILLSIRANLLKYREIKATKLRSKTVNIMSYLPTIIYLSSLAVFVLHTLLLGDETHPSSEPLGVFTWGLTFTVVVGLLVLLVISTKVINKFIMKLEKTPTIFFDLIFSAFALASIIISVVVLSTYNKAFGEFAFYHKGDLQLLVIYVIAFVAFFKLAAYVVKVIKTDELMLNANIDDIRTGNAPVHVKNAEYKLAYESIRKEYEAYFATNKDKNVILPQNVEEEVVENPTEEAK